MNSQFMPHKTCRFGHDVSTMKCTLLGEQSTFSILSRPPFERFSWNFIYNTLRPCCLRHVILFSVSQKWRALYLENKVTAQLYLILHSRNFP